MTNVPLSPPCFCTWYHKLPKAFQVSDKQISRSIASFVPIVYLRKTIRYHAQMIVLYNDTKDLYVKLMTNQKGVNCVLIFASKYICK